MSSLDATDIMLNDLFSTEIKSIPIKKTLQKYNPIKEKVQCKVFKTNLKKVMRKGKSEANLFELFGGGLEIGTSYHVISGGDIDSLSFLQVVLNEQKLDYCLFSTWCMAMNDIEMIEKWLCDKQIKRLDAYVGEIFPNSYSKEWEKLSDVMKRYDGRVCVFRNHAKIYAGIGSKFSFAIESSANINTNPRTEQTCITIDKELYLFYKDFYDGINSFNRDFDNWTPYDR